MVSFQTAEIYNEDQDNIIGVKVTVSADNGQVIDEIQVTNKTDFEELEAKLDALGDDYVQFDEDSPMSGMTIDDILSNVSETLNINATTLNGIQSDGYAKTNHTHQKSNITNLYNYDISLSRNNVNLESENKTVTVTVKVTDMSNAAVSGHSVIIYKDGSTWVSGTTNSSGVFSNNYTAEKGGLTTFSVNNQKVQLFCDGWQSEVLINTATTQGGNIYHQYVKLSYNTALRLASCEIQYDNFKGFASEVGTKYLWAGNIIPSDYVPVSQVRMPTQRGDVVITISPAGQIAAHALTQIPTANIKNLITWHY